MQDKGECMRIVITGHYGQLGTALKQLLQDQHELFLIDVPLFDITDRTVIVQAITNFRPDIVIHTAAFTNVDGCTREPDKAYQINALGTQNIALACQRVGAALVFISTNEVFDGAATQPYLEFDATNPINVYGRSKLAGEWYTQMLLQQFYIVRTAWLFAPAGNNFVSKIIRAADERGQLTVVDDEISSPTYAPDLALAIVRLLATEAFGIYHFTNEGICSRYDFAVEILKGAGRAHIPVQPIKAEQYERVSSPPLYAPLRNFCGASLSLTLRPWQEALEEYLRLEHSA